MFLSVLSPCKTCVQYIGGCAVHWEGGGGVSIQCIERIS